VDEDDIKMDVNFCKMKHMGLEDRPSSAYGWRRKIALNSGFNKCPNEYQFDELKFMMKILDMELRVDDVKWHQDSEV
jgi:hypothetical protein